MTKEQQIKEIREKCIEANPEIVELKFGCFVMTVFKKTKTRIPVQVCLIDKNYAGNWIVTPWVSGAGTITIKEKDIDEIIGRPIRLADVLLALNKSVSLGCYPQYNDMLLINANDTHKTSGFWNLLKDSLTEQSEETITFIHQLICK